MAPAGSEIVIRSVALLDADDLAVAEPGDAAADLCVLAGVPADVALRWVDRLAASDPSRRPAALVTKEAPEDLCRAAGEAGIAVGAMHAQARAELVLSTVRSLIEGAASRQLEPAAGEPFAEESDLYGLAQRVAALTRGLVSIEDDQSRLLAYSATDGAADELRMLSILGREGPAEHLRRLRELGVFDRLRRGSAVIEVPADPELGWRRRLVVSISPLDPDANAPGRHRGRTARASLGTIWLQEGFQPLDPDVASVLEGAAAIAARLIHRIRTAPTQEALQVQRLLGIRGGGVDVPSLASALALPTAGPAVVVGIAPTGTHLPPVADLTAALRLLAGAYARDSLVSGTGQRLYVLLPRARPGDVGRWVGTVLDRLTSRFGAPLRAAVAAPVADLAEVPAARAEVDRVLDRPAGPERVTTLTESRTPVLLGEIAELVGSRAELDDPRLTTLIAYDADRDAALVDTVEHYLLHFGDVRGAAADLHIHPNTLRYRIRRAEQLLGMSLDDPDSRLLLQIQLLARRRPGAAG
ncbi:PucR family transcriptional regulator [Microlunatus ginsengisoli]|uniref:Helix-turn-helix domain-containing protein n=1 Tax=Microlunatus ginsengisoli TaxID=363863 RepID=A0ABP7AST6_9ACTN